MFSNVLIKKSLNLSSKKIDLKKALNLHFSKEVRLWFLSKNKAIFHVLF